MFNTSLAGEYKLEIKRNGIIVKETDWFDNLVLDSGLDRIGSVGQSVLTVCRVGTGSSTPYNSQSSLDSQIAYTTNYSNTSNTNKGSPYYQSEIVHAYTFTQGAIVGNITEVGIGWTNTGAGLFSRALILDTNGNPTAITLTSIDQLTVYYKLSVYPSLADTTGSFVISGTTYNYTARIANVGSFMTNGGFSNGSLASGYSWSVYRASPNYPVIGAVTGNINGTYADGYGVYNGNNGQGYISPLTYISGSYYIDMVFYGTINYFNAAGGIGAFNFNFSNGTNNYQVVLNQPIPKDNTKTFSITTRFSWSRT